MFKHIKKSSKYLALLSMITLFSACSDMGNEDANNVEDGSNQFVSATLLDDIDAAVMLQVVQSAIDPTATNAFAYKALKITYNTKGQNGEDIVASGLLVIPTATEAYKAYLASLGKAFSVAMICDNHGTIFTNAEAPSNVEVSNGMPDYSLGVLMSGYAGFAGVYPDYIGYGDSNDISHPYMLKKASARASLDMIKASMNYMSNNGVLLNHQLYISGYSQGGYTAMALAEEIQSSNFDVVDVKGLAPMAGPHDLAALGDIELDATHTMVYPAFLAYLADSYSYYNSDIELSSLVNMSDTEAFHTLFDGSNSNIAIHMGLGLVTDAQAGFNQHKADVLFKDSLINDYQNNVNSLLRSKFVENSTYNWVPKTKVNLIHCVEDEIIPFSMSQKAYDTFIANGVDSANLTLSPIPTEIIDPIAADNPFVHGRCAATAYGASVKWFAGIRSGDIK